MKKFNWVKKGATAVVMAGLLATAMPATALAEGDVANEPASLGQSIVKNWNYGNSPYDKDYEFEFELEYDNSKAPIQAGSNTVVAPTLKKNTQDADGKVSFKADRNDASKSTATGSSDLRALIDEYDFTAPGSYYFTLSETNPNTDDNDNNNKPNIDFTNKTYSVRVDVVWKTDENGTPTTDTEIQSVFVFDGKNKVDNAVFNNGNKAASNNLTIDKVVAGTAANTADYFQYTLTVTGADGSYPVKKVSNGMTTDAGTVTNGNAFTFYLKSGESVYVVGLPEGATYTVVEGTGTVTATTSENGTISFNYDDKTDNNYYEQSKKTGDEGWTGSDKQNVNAALTVNGTVSATTENNVSYKNNKGFAPETGITMNTLPFVAVAAVAVAGGVTLIISRNRRAHEDF